MFITLIKKRKKEIINSNYGWSYSKERKSKFNFLKHNEFDTERKIENKNPFEYDKSASTLKCNETDYKIFAPNMDDTVGKDIAFVNTLNYMQYCHLSIYSNFPLIIKGSTGSGKNNAINYLEKYLGFDLIYFKK